jgi:hypothetical protein
MCGTAQPLSKTLNLLRRLSPADAQDDERRLHKQELERLAELEHRTSGYQRISVETFVLDGADLAAKAAKLSLNGAFVREGNLAVLYADARSAMMASQGLHTSSRTS